MAVFFDSAPTTQSRLLTFRCPNYRDSDPGKEHFITIAWKSRDGHIQVLLENVRYQGKPLALTPDAIKGHEGDSFPEGILYTTCTCLPRKNNRLCYIASEVTDAANKRETAKEPSLKVTKKISKDIKASTRLLIQIYDGVEALAEFSKDSHEIFLEKFQELQTRVIALEKAMEKLHKMIGGIKEDLHLEAPPAVVSVEKKPEGTFSPLASQGSAEKLQKFVDAAPIVSEQLKALEDEMEVFLESGECMAVDIASPGEVVVEEDDAPRVGITKLMEAAALKFALSRYDEEHPEVSLPSHKDTSPSPQKSGEPRQEKTLKDDAAGDISG